MSSGLVVVLGLALLVDAAVRGSWDVVLQALGPIAVVVWGVWVLMVRPTVVVTPDQLTVTNPLRVVELPWGSVADVRMRYQIVIETTEPRRLTCWGGPTLPRPKPARRGERPVMPTSGELTVVLDAWAVARDRGVDNAAAVVRRWDRPALVAGAVALALLVVSLLV
ncbi:PH domain-containing protein [Curtobacterium sp. VKM Ac-2922]|uniref:PH domain-containing protein n=1 Tax=Curtobacterium sp. VKM Ac-2922 TaxID=2929475 RepID=UPI001FB3B3AF|nr:PH domain-containing protein [Curtobacterium sp. VKM Ac-2922]MCJ1713212.1 PH domain-containing protein [Curtobacterium sp. VKM Ac-2922]